jgi:adenine-specific DNA-methyltransferase
MLKLAKKEKVSLTEEELKKAFSVFERQANIDYFINKDAKKFLSEQLDMWIYQYMFSQEADFDLKRFEQIKQIKSISLKLIDFIGQFENELVKIWNKPRFVTNSNIVVSMDKLIDKGYDTSKLTTHHNYKEQQAEWKELGIIEDEGLLDNPYLPIDTKYFKDLQEEIEALFEEYEFDGLLIKSENYQALNTIQPRYKGKIDLIYIDPPFNTGDDFAYIDKFQDSTWLSLMENRLTLARELMSKRGNFYLHLDTKANYFGRFLMDNILGKDKFINEIIWCYSGPGYWKKNFVRKHDMIFYYGDIKKSIFKPQFVAYKSGIHVSKDGIVKTFGGGEKASQSEEIEERGKPVEDWWTDIYATDRYRNEMEGFETQKPETLLERIIEASSNINSIVLDYHSGSGTTIITAHKLGRKWIGIEMGEHFETVNIPRMKKTISGVITGISKKLEKDNNLKKGGLFKYYELEQYEQILRNLQYTDVPNKWLENLKSEEISDCFLFDGKLSEALNSRTKEYTVDITKIYENIDLKETIHNLTGKRPTEVTDTTVTYADGSSYPLMQIIKPLLVW